MSRADSTVATDAAGVTRAEGLAAARAARGRVRPHVGVRQPRARGARGAAPARVRLAG